MQQGKALKEHRAREVEKSGGSAAHLVSKESRDAASKAQAAAAEWFCVEAIEELIFRTTVFCVASYYYFICPESALANFSNR